MGTITMKKIRNIINKLKQIKGFSFAEALIAMGIVSLVTVGVATGARFAVERYNDMMILSESKILYSTLIQIIQDELCDTDNIKLGDEVEDNIYVLEGYSSKKYRNNLSEFSTFYALEKDDEGQPFIGPSKGGEIWIGWIDGVTKDADGHYVNTGSSYDADGSFILSSASYSMYKLDVIVEPFYNTEYKLFHVKISVSADTGQEYVHRFDVLPLSNKEITIHYADEETEPADDDEP